VLHFNGYLNKYVYFCSSHNITPIIRQCIFLLLKTACIALVTIGINCIQECTILIILKRCFFVLHFNGCLNKYVYFCSSHNITPIARQCIFLLLKTACIALVTFGINCIQQCMILIILKLCFFCAAFQWIFE
jgi:hypothetical protein